MVFARLVGLKLYAELVCCTNFSFQQGASHPEELVHRSKSSGYQALAITDECTLAGIVRAHEAALETGIKLIIGSQFSFPDGNRIVLLAPSHAAYSQICELITKARRVSEKGTYKVERNDFEKDVDECIGLWLPPATISSAYARWFSALPLVYRAFAFTHTLAQRSLKRLQQLTALGSELGIPLVAAGDVKYHARDRRPLHDVMTAIRLHTTVDKIGRAGLPNGERHLRSLKTLQRLYPAQLLQESIAIADRCTFGLKSLHYQYPEELVPKGHTPGSYLRLLTEEGVQRRWPEGVTPHVRDLIEKELKLIEELRFEHYFLTVEEMVRFARSRGILCQGRGSAANSAVCYALGVTEVDPARISVLFERFISKERHEPPDIDIDFEHQRREEVIQHIYDKYGRHRAALAATVIAYRRRSAVRDVGKALGIPLDVVDAIAKSLYWFDDPAEVSRQLMHLGLQPDAVVVRNFLKLVPQLIGFPRHLSQHVGGFVISHHPLSSLVPVENAAMPDRTIIQWDKNDLESLGLLKVDCLALGMLSAIRRALELKSSFDGKTFRMQDIPAEDPATYEMLCKAESVGVFQIESRAQMTMLPRLKPREFFDLVVQVAIIRPGPIQGGMVHPYLRRRQGLEPIKYPSPDLERVLGRTFGVPLFQEQVMEIAMVAAGFSPGEADKVRRSMAAWQRRGGLAQFRDRLKQGMLERGYTGEFADQIYQQILGFGSYGFPESHAASFALLAYASSWLRCHEHPAFVAGLLNSQPMGFYQPAQLIHDARRHEVVFRPVDVNESQWDCTLERGMNRKAEVRLGFRMVSGLAEAQCKMLVSAREGRPYQSVDDLWQRAGIDKRTLRLLAGCGSLSNLSGHRRQAHWNAIGVQQLTGVLSHTALPESRVALRPTSEADEIVYDYQSMDLSLGRHPLALLRSRLQRANITTAADLTRCRSGSFLRVAGIVTHRQRPETASGVIFMSLEDETGIVNVIVWPRIQQEQRLEVFGARLVVVFGELQSEQGVIHVVARRFEDRSSWLGRLPTVSRDFH